MTKLTQEIVEAAVEAQARVKMFSTFRGTDWASARAAFQTLIDAAREQLGQQAAAPPVEPGLEDIAQWMIAHSYATGHGDTIADLLAELVEQAKEHALAVAPPPAQPSIDPNLLTEARHIIHANEADEVIRTGRGLTVALAQALLAALSTPPVRGGK